MYIIRGLYLMLIGLYRDSVGNDLLILSGHGLAGFPSFGKQNCTSMDAHIII